MKSVQSLLFFKPMKEEPEEHHWSTMDSYKMNLKIMQTSKGPYLRVSHTIKENPMEDGVQWIRLPYLVGEKCYVRETWCLYHTINMRRLSGGRYSEEISDGLYGYKADGFDSIQDFKEHIELISDSSFIDIVVKDDRWQSPVVMPVKAARRFVTILSCEPMRVEEVTEEDCVKMGVDSSKYGKTYRFAFLFDWEQRHPDKPWAWRVESEEETIGTN